MAARHRALAAELISHILTIRHWQPYLWGRRFVVRTDHFSLKCLLDQCLATIPQHHWVGKLLGFDFTVEYKPSTSNIVADALSHRDIEEGAMLAVFVSRFNYIMRLRQAQSIDPALVATRDAILAGSRGALWGLCDDMVTFDSRFYIPPSFPLLQEVLAAIHEDSHEGVQRTLHRLHRDFHFPDMRHMV